MPVERITKIKEREESIGLKEAAKVAAQKFSAAPMPAQAIPGRIILEDPSTHTGKPDVADFKKEGLFKSAVPETHERLVETGELHSAVRLNGKTESNLSRISDLKMVWVRGEGLLIRTNDRNGQVKESFIPAANVKIVTFK